MRISHTVYVTCDKSWSLRDTSQTLSRFLAPLVLTDFTNSFYSELRKGSCCQDSTRDPEAPTCTISVPQSSSAGGHRELCTRGLAPQGQVHQPREWVFLYAVRRKRKDGSSSDSVLCLGIAGASGTLFIPGPHLHGNNTNTRRSHTCLIYTFHFTQTQRI